MESETHIDKGPTVAEIKYIKQKNLEDLEKKELLNIFKIDEKQFEKRREIERFLTQEDGFFGLYQLDKERTYTSVAGDFSKQFKRQLAEYTMLSKWDSTID